MEEQQIEDVVKVKEEVVSKGFSTITIVAVVVIAGLIVAGVVYMMGQNSDSLSAKDGALTSSGEVAYPEVVAIVNGKEITGKELTQSVVQQQQAAQQQGLDPNDIVIKAQIQTQAMDVLINTTLLNEAASSAGIVVAEEQIAEQMSQLEAQFGGAEALKAQMDTLGITEESLREDIITQISIGEYLKTVDEYTNIVVTDEEVSVAYDRYASQSPELPPLAEIAEQIKAQLLAEKQQVATGTILEKLRADAEIETKI